MVISSIRVIERPQNSTPYALHCSAIKLYLVCTKNIAPCANSINYVNQFVLQLCKNAVFNDRAESKLRNLKTCKNETSEQDSYVYYNFINNPFNIVVNTPSVVVLII